MKRFIILNLIFIIGLLGANYNFHWDWYSVKTFISGGLTGVWIFLLLKKLWTK